MFFQINHYATQIKISSDKCYYTDFNDMIDSPFATGAKPRL